MRVVVLDDYQGVALGHAAWEDLDAEVVAVDRPIRDDADLGALLADADVVVAMRERTVFTAARLRRLPALQLLVTTGRANAAIDLDEARARGIVVCGTDSPPAATAELTWGLILATLRSIPHEDAGMRRGQWQTTVGGDLAGRTLGIVGLGRLGARVAAVGAAFGMEVIAWSQNLDPVRAAEAGARAVRKEELFASSDVVTVHYKLSDRSRGIVGARELAMMRRSAILVNTSRGPLVDTDALIRALRGGRLRGAGLDVFDVEPLPADHPLLSAPGTVLTPHLGYVTDDTYAVFYAQAVENITAWAAGRPLRRLA
jgi:phosphoglycerate dehydrogenase-like enzyme